MECVASCADAGPCVIGSADVCVCLPAGRPHQQYWIGPGVIGRPHQQYWIGPCVIGRPHQQYWIAGQCLQVHSGQTDMWWCDRVL